jgi:MOSC domain-containing protein YiiM
MPRKLDFHGKEWESAIFKSPVSARVCLERTNLDGDRQYNLKFHGGPDKAVCCYASEHYSYWQNDFGMGDIFTYYSVKVVCMYRFRGRWYVEHLKC